MFGIDDAAAVATIAAAVVGLLGQAWETGKGIADNIVGETVQKKYRELTKKLSKAMKENDSFREKVTAAYNANNTRLLQNLVYANPVGAAFHSVQEQLTSENEKYKNAMDQATKKANDINAAQNQMASGLQSGTSAFWNADSAKKQMDAAAQSVLGGLRNNNEQDVQKQ